MALPLSSLLEALLFAAGEPLSKKRIATLLGVGTDEVSTTAATLRGELQGRGLQLIETPTDLELRTQPEVAELVTKLREAELSRDLGKASLETLAIILYHEGATRTEIDWIRGVNSGTALRALLLRGLIERVDAPHDKRRARYVATIDALAHLGVGTLEALPRFAEFRHALSEHAAEEAPHSHETA